MKYYLEYQIKEGVWKIYNLENKLEGAPAECIRMLSSEIFDKLIEKLLEKLA